MKYTARSVLAVGMLLAVVLVTMSASGEVYAQTCVAKRSDALTKIAEVLFPGAGKDSGLSKLFALNPHLKNTNVIWGGELIRLTQGAPKVSTREEDLRNCEEIVDRIRAGKEFLKDIIAPLTGSAEDEKSGPAVKTNATPSAEEVKAAIPKAPQYGAINGGVCTSKKGDTLSKLARALIPGEFGGKESSYRKIIALNPQLKNPNVISGGELIRFADAATAQSQFPDPSRSCDDVILEIYTGRAPAAVVQGESNPQVIEKPKVAKHESHVEQAKSVEPKSAPQTRFADPELAAKLESEKAERERRDRSKAEQLKAEREKAEREKLEREKAEQLKAEREKAERERLEREKVEQEKAEQLKAEREKAEREKLEREKALSQKALAPEFDPKQEEMCLAAKGDTAYKLASKLIAPLYRKNKDPQAKLRKLNPQIKKDFIVSQGDRIRFRNLNLRSPARYTKLRSCDAVIHDLEIDKEFESGLFAGEDKKISVEKSDSPASVKPESEKESVKSKSEVRVPASVEKAKNRPKVCIAKQGDTMSKLSRALLPGNYLGSNNVLTRMLALNPHLKNPNAIQQGDLVRFSEADPESPDVEEEVLSCDDVIEMIESEKEYDSGLFDLQSYTGFRPHSIFDVGLGAKWFALFGYDPADTTRGRLLSQLTPTIDLFWRQRWTERAQSRVYYGIEAARLYPETNGVKVDGGDLANQRFGVGASYRLAEFLAFNLDVELKQELFYQGTAKGGLRINQIPLIKVSPGLDVRLFKFAAFSASFIGGYSYWSASYFDNYVIQNGIGYHAAIQLSKTVRQTKVSCEVNYKERGQNTSWLIFTQKETGTICDFSWRID